MRRDLEDLHGPGTLAEIARLQEASLAHALAHPEDALAIAHGAGAPHGGLLLDIWHVNRGNIDYSEFAAMPREYLKHVELDDAGPLEGSIMEATLNRRRLPGEGDFDIAGFLRAVAASGYEGVYGVEILSETQRQLFPAEAAQRSFDATMAQFAKA